MRTRSGSGATMAREFCPEAAAVARNVGAQRGRQIARERRNTMAVTAAEWICGLAIALVLWKLL